MPPTLTPKQILVHHSADDWEEFIYEWVIALKEAEYVDVVRMGGPTTVARTSRPS
ncbi:hypothetical protein [Streptomyces sp. NPDC004286]|uniref:hypothetical protein n=1 Tax=Streptomyces sp. NPDC004286 TaxID=3364696 RepID=UPI00368211AD